MTITSFQVQNILRTYAKQLSRGQRLARDRAATAPPPPKDQVNISIEARRKQVIEKITSEIVENIGARVPGLAQDMGSVEDQALGMLAKEYGSELELSQDESSGRLNFAALDKESGEMRDLGSAESARLQERLYVITQGIIDQNMI